MESGQLIWTLFASWNCPDNFILEAVSQVGLSGPLIVQIVLFEVVRTVDCADCLLIGTV